MKPTDFSINLTNFLSKFLPGEKGISSNTIASYKYTFILFISFMEQKRNINVSKIELKSLTKESIIAFLNWLETDRRSSASTRNVRLAAIHSFFRFLQYQHPENLSEWQNILSIKSKKTEKETISYLSIDGMKLLLEQPDIRTSKGRRDLAMLALMYDCAARVQEIIDLTPSSVRLEKPFTIKLYGKGKKARIVPLMAEEIAHIKRYMQEEKQFVVNRMMTPLFHNSRNEKLTRVGINSILKKYADLARNLDKAYIPKNISCHTLRHSKAMHLLQAGVHLVYIRDFLGHSSVLTTEIYARADSKQKREAIEKAYVNIVKNESAEWIENTNLLTWLKAFN